MKGRILLVDDEEIVLRSCQRILGGDYEIDTARDGLAALGMVNEKDYDVLVLDIKMPRMDGIEVLRRVKEARPDVDVIMVTGLHEIGTAVKAMKLGALDYLPKPFEPEELRLAVGRAFDRRAALRGPGYRDFLARMYGNEPRQWDPALSGQDRLRLVANVMTRIRYLHRDGGLEFLHKCAPAEAPAELLPWFDVPGRQSAGVKVLFGHWSTLGLLARADVVALDTGCLWGGQLSAIRLEDARLFQVGCHPRRQPKPHG